MARKRFIILNFFWGNSITSFTSLCIEYVLNRIFSPFFIYNPGIPHLFFFFFEMWNHTSWLFYVWARGIHTFLLGKPPPFPRKSPANNTYFSVYIEDLSHKQKTNCHLLDKTMLNAILTLFESKKLRYMKQMWYQVCRSFASIFYCYIDIKIDLNKFIEISEVQVWWWEHAIKFNYTFRVPWLSALT